MPRRLLVTLVMLVTLALLGMSRPSSAAAPVAFFGRSVKPLLYVTANESLDFDANQRRSQLYIFRDGTVLSGSLYHRFLGPRIAAADLFSGKASPESLAELAIAMAAAKVGYQTDCKIDPPDAPLEWDFQFHWFGIGERQNAFAATSEGPDCPAAIEALIFAVGGVRGSAFLNATTRLSIPER